MFAAMTMGLLHVCSLLQVNLPATASQACFDPLCLISVRRSSVCSRHALEAISREGKVSMKWKRLIVSAAMAGLLALSMSAAASAAKLHPCNSGAGNGPEQCDPGNSGPKDG
jgi:hypothetical protein